MLLHSFYLCYEWVLSDVAVHGSQFLHNFCTCVLSVKVLFMSSNNCSLVEYEVVVVTGNMKGAGTDAKVSVIIFGKTGQTPKLRLKSNSKNCFERNQSDIFNLKTVCVGPMTKIRCVLALCRGEATLWTAGSPIRSFVFTFPCLRSQVVTCKQPKLGLTQELFFSRISESTTGYTFTPCVGSFTSPGIDTR